MPVKEVIVAEPHGYCGGVRRAIQIVQETAKEQPNKTFLLGEIVHNKHVVDWLEKEHRVQTVHRLDEILPRATVIIRAHGAPPSIYKKAEEEGLKIVDATCPLVARVHEEVRSLAKEGKKILYIASKKTHDEAIGVVGEAPKAVTLTTLKEWDEVEIVSPENTVVLTQTTLSALETKETLGKLKKKYPGLTIEPHICPATTQRQQAVIELAKEIGFVVIVGSPTSSNSNRLREVAEEIGAKAHIVDTADELNPEWFKGIERVAVSSGASTPEWLLEEVIERIKKI